MKRRCRGLGKLANLLVLALAYAAPRSCPAQQIISPGPAQLDQASDDSSVSAEKELQVGIGLTKRGSFAEAIPYFLASRGHVVEQYAAEFNLALCYVGTKQFSEAIKILKQLEAQGHADANVENLLAQSYVEMGDAVQAWPALQRAAKLSPKNEKLYLFVADACTDRQDYELGLQVVALGLSHLPDSARLHFERAYFLSMLNQWDKSKSEFDLTSQLAPNSEIAYVAAGQKNLFAGNLPEAIRISRAAEGAGHANYLSRTILGEALIRSGAIPGQPELSEAESALRQAVASRPNYANARILLGYLLLTENELDPAREQLETARQLASKNPAVYSHLAVVYRKLGKTEEATATLAKLAQLNAQEVRRINSASGETLAIP